jgi:Tetratricopeptide repeat
LISLCVKVPSFQYFPPLVVDWHPEPLDYSVGITSEQRDWYKEIALEQRALKDITTVLGEHHPTTLTIMGNLAATYLKLGLWDEGVIVQKRLLAGCRAVLDQRNPMTVRTIANLARAYGLKLEQRDESLARQEWFLEQKITELGEQHPDIQMTKDSLVAAFGPEEERWDGPVAIQTMVLTSRIIGRLGFRHPDTLTIMSDLAQAHGKRRQMGTGTSRAGVGTGRLDRSARGVASDHTRGQEQSRHDTF